MIPLGLPTGGMNGIYFTKNLINSCMSNLGDFSNNVPLHSSIASVAVIYEHILPKKWHI